MDNSTTLSYKRGFWRGRLKVDCFLSLRRTPESRRVLNLSQKRTWMPVFTGMTNFHFACSMP